MPPGSTIINTTSIQAYEPSPILVDYASTKAAINAFTKGLAGQLAPEGHPRERDRAGADLDAAAAGGRPARGGAVRVRHADAARPPGQPAELAPAYVFLASAESSYVSGETLNVNGGMPTP